MLLLRPSFELTPSSTVLLEKAVRRLSASQETSTFMEPGGLLPSLQKPVTAV
jgi:hypothetical protein